MRSTPSFQGLRPSSAASSRAMQRNRPHDTRAELELRRALRHLGLRYRKNVRALPGCPDVVFARARLAVFCDGDFWHGRDWPKLRTNLERRANAPYWIAKIETNRARDIRINQQLAQAGWRVLRLWETDILRDVDTAAQRVRAAL